MSKNKPRCDVHMYLRKTKCNFFVFMTTNFGGHNVFSPFNYFNLSHTFLKVVRTFRSLIRNIYGFGALKNLLIMK